MMCSYKCVCNAIHFLVFFHPRRRECAVRSLASFRWHNWVSFLTVKHESHECACACILPLPRCNNTKKHRRKNCINLLSSVSGGIYLFCRLSAELSAWPQRTDTRVYTFVCVCVFTLYCLIKSIGLRARELLFACQWPDAFYCASHWYNFEIYTNARDLRVAAASVCVCVFCCADLWPS